MPVELHDGIQVEIPGEAKLFGFAVNSLRVNVNGKWKNAFTAAPGTLAAVAVPEDAPVITVGQQLYLASSQAVKQAFPYFVPKEGDFAPRLDADWRVVFTLCQADGSGNAAMHCRIDVEMRVALPPRRRGLAEEDVILTSTATAVVDAFPARDAEGALASVRKAFSRLGGSAFRLKNLTFDNPGQLYVKPGELNAVRREAIAAMTAAVAAKQSYDNAALKAALQPAASPKEAAALRTNTLAWSVFVETPDLLEEFRSEDIALADEAVIGIDSGWLDHSEALARVVSAWPREKIRFALPLLAREDMQSRLSDFVTKLRRGGWKRWMVSGLAGWSLLNKGAGLDLAADWPLYILNHVAANELFRLGFSRLSVSPEDDFANYANLLASVGEASERFECVVYSHLPLLISAVCAHASAGLCKSKQKKADKQRSCAKAALPVRLASGRSGICTATDCGTILTENKPFPLLPRLQELQAAGIQRVRMDFRWRRCQPGEVVELWRSARKAVWPEELSAHSIGNYIRGLQ